MKYKVGDYVYSLIERGRISEGDLLKVDAIHSKERSYACSLYLTEDAKEDEAIFFEEELSPAEEKETGPLPIESGDEVITLSDMPGAPKGSEGTVLESYPKSKGAAVQIHDTPYVLPYPWGELKKKGAED